MRFLLHINDPKALEDGPWYRVLCLELDDIVIVKTRIWIRILIPTNPTPSPLLRVKVNMRSWFSPKRL